MPSTQPRIPSDTLSSLGRAAHDAGLAALLGGNLYGRVAMHPALGDVSDASERGRVVNRAWRRYSWINSAGLLAVVAGWVGARVNEAKPSSLSPRERRLALAKDASVAAVTSDRRGHRRNRDALRKERRGRRSATRGWQPSGPGDLRRSGVPQASGERAEHPRAPSRSWRWLPSTLRSARRTSGGRGSGACCGAATDNRS